MIRKRRNSSKISLQRLLKEHDLDPKPSKVKSKGIFGIFSSFIGIIIIAVMIGVLASIPLLIAASAALPIAEAGLQTWEELPSELDEIQIAEINTLYDVNGKVFAEVWLENRIELESLDEISPEAIEALIATEDKRFYEHSGFDIIGTARSALLRSGGGSGITQQTIKNLRFYNQAGIESKEEAVETTLSRKLAELKLSLNYEKKHEKDEILLTYFNTVAMGASNIYGIEAASNYFFGKTAKELNLAESSALIGTVQNPVDFDMRYEENKDFWKKRQKEVLTRLVEDGVITQEESDEAYETKLDLLMEEDYSGDCASSSDPNYCNYVVNTLRTDPRLGESQEERESIISKGGLNIYTYYDPEETAVVRNILKNDFGDGNRIVAPTAVVEPGTGGVRVLAVNRGYGEGEGETTLNFPNLPTATGSTYKVITLAAALNNGYNENTLNFSSACPLYPGEQYDYPPGGFVNSVSCSFQGGPMDYKRATAVSSNTWFITLEQRIGVKALKDFSRDLGLSAPDYITDASLAYTLGPVENAPVDMAAAFATFANQGIFCPATPIISYEYSDGSKPKIPDNYDPSLVGCKRVMSPGDASIVLKALRANTSSKPYDDAFGRENYIKGDLAVGKSGTNELYNSAWAQVSSNFSLFIDLYDPVDIKNLIEWVHYKGRLTNWSENSAQKAGGEIMRALIAHDPPEPLDFNNSDFSFNPLPVDLSGFYIVPSVIGMEPEVAVEILENLEIEVKVKREKTYPESMFPPGVVVEQSIQSGTRLAEGTQKEIILTISE